MPTRSGRKLKERLTISCDPINIDRINKSLDTKEFSSVSGLVNNALSFYFENRGKEQKAVIKNYLESPEGEEIIVKIVDKRCENMGILSKDLQSKKGSPKSRKTP